MYSGVPATTLAGQSRKNPLLSPLRRKTLRRTETADEQEGGLGGGRGRGGGDSFFCSKICLKNSFYAKID